MYTSSSWFEYYVQFNVKIQVRLLKIQLITWYLTSPVLWQITDQKQIRGLSCSGV